MNIALLLSHSIEEYDQVRLLSSLGYNVFSIGGYIDPSRPHDPKRPALPEVQAFPELKAAVDALGTDDNLGAAQTHIPDAVLEWADVILFHHYLDARLFPQWDRVKHKRVIWRTVGQSVEHNERLAAPFRDQGLQIVRYSPKEANIPGYAGADALIRFYKDPADFLPWKGDVRAVINITQHLKARDPYTNWGFWDAATKGLPAIPLGPGSEEIGGQGELSYQGMLEWLSRARVYLYTGTQPASYTLGLIEAMMTGVPVVSIPWHSMNVFPYGPDLFEGPEITGLSGHDVEAVHSWLRIMLTDHDVAQTESERQRALAIELFGRETIGAQWKAFLG